MAGAGIGKCILCGRDNQPLVSDICQDCTMDEFWAVLGSGKDSIAAIAVDHEKYRAAARFDGTGINDIVEVCPHGHVGRGIMLEADPIEAADGDMIERVKWECELCGEIWWENTND